LALININGVAIPTPSDYVPGILDISKAERNANGNMIIERIATKRKLELGWKFMNQQNMSLILNAISPVFFTVDYFDAQLGAMKTGTFYSGDRNPPAFRFINGVLEYKDVKFNLIEK
jgi:hypothetical protein